MSPDDERHGTTAGYSTHIRNRVTPCEPCRAANRKRAIRRRAKIPCVGCGDLTWTGRCRTCASRKVTHALPDHELAWDGHWVRVGLIWKPAEREAS